MKQKNKISKYISNILSAEVSNPALGFVYSTSQAKCRPKVNDAVPPPPLNLIFLGGRCGVKNTAQKNAPTPSGKMNAQGISAERQSVSWGHKGAKTAEGQHRRTSTARMLKTREPVHTRAAADRSYQTRKKGIRLNHQENEKKHGRDKGPNRKHESAVHAPDPILNHSRGKQAHDTETATPTATYTKRTAYKPPRSKKKKAGPSASP